MQTTGIIVGLLVLLVMLIVDDQADDGSDDGSDNSTPDGSGLGSGVSTVFSNVSDFVAAWAHAIAPAENVNPAYNDPGGLDMEGDLGSVHASGGAGNLVIGVFSTLDKGYQALENVLTSYVTNHGDLTMLQATSRYITGKPGNSDPSTYPASVLNEATIVATRLGVGLQDTLSSIVGGGN